MANAEKAAVPCMSGAAGTTLARSLPAFWSPTTTSSSVPSSGYLIVALRFRTPREFLDHAARGAEVSQPAAGWLGRYLGFCDRIKFARGSADAAARSGLLDAAESFLRHGRLDSAPTQTEPPAEGARP